MNKRKQLTFDIDTNVAKEILGGQNYTNIYTNIRRYMEKNNWIHIEGSVYMSKSPLTNTDVSFLIRDLKSRYPYLIKCIREMHQSDISNIHDLHQHFDYDGTPGNFSIKSTQPKTAQNTEINRKRKSR